MDNFERKIEDLIRKVEEAKKGKAIDLTLDEDLSIAVMNLVSIEEHFFFTAEKTGKKDKYLDLLTETREIRKELMKKLVGAEPEGEVWCLSKHLLAAAMRLIEVGTKARAKGERKEAEEFFDKAFRLYSLFWAINLKAIDVSDVKKISEGALNKEDKTESGASDKFNELLQKLLDCCGE
jgi:tetratricopeptide (TPR) repeat protein